jgi:hypothetical protein
MTEELQQDFNEVNEQTAGSVDITMPEVTPILDAEWCFQFFDNEPYVFAWSSENEEAGALTIELKPVESEGLVFQNNGMTFKIFPRPISEETKQRRLEENASKNKEA